MSEQRFTFGYRRLADCGFVTLSGPHATPKTCGAPASFVVERLDGGKAAIHLCAEHFRHLRFQEDLEGRAREATVRRDD